MHLVVTEFDLSLGENPFEESISPPLHGPLNARDLNRIDAYAVDHDSQ
jgi:hypothetical protein